MHCGCHSNPSHVAHAGLRLYDCKSAPAAANGGDQLLIIMYKGTVQTTL
jgi:hypothetical protein